MELTCHPVVRLRHDRGFDVDHNRRQTGYQTLKLSVVGRITSPQFSRRRRPEETRLLR